MDLSLIAFNTSLGASSSRKEAKYTAAFLSISTESQWVSLICLSSRFIKYSPSFFLRKLSLKKTPSNLRS